MTLTKDDLKKLDEATGGSVVDAGVSGATSPNGANMLGALNAIVRISEQMDEYNQTLADLPADKQTELQEAQQDFQYCLAELSNLFPDNFVGEDDSIETDSGTVIDLPEAATAGDTSKTVPSNQ